MRIGHTLANRFVLEKLAGRGGMGEVYCALDQSTGQRVAVKVLRGQQEEELARFEREARILAELDHTRIVRYIAHGALTSGEPYLAMEWLDGEDLAARLARERLGMADCLALALAVAEALGVLHERDIVHRDLKPSNVFLVDGRIDQIKLLDFGLARLGDGTRMTSTGTLVGTIAYMAPEQARGAETLDGSGDIFALGCVLFECLTGQPAFSAEHATAILTKLLFEEAPRLGDRLPGAPAALEALVASMLSKRPSERPRDGRAAAEALRAVLDLTPIPAPDLPLPDAQHAPTRDMPHPRGLTDSEQWTAAVILIGAPGESARNDMAVADERLRSEAASYGGTFERLLDGSAAVMLSGTTVATDMAAQAARCALALSRHAGGRRIALAMRRSDRTGRLLVGSAIDWAARLLDSAHQVLPVPDAQKPPPITLDDATAGLLDARFDVRDRGGVYVLQGERRVAEVRTLLGKPTPCVGRERELRVLEGLLDDCIEDSRAHAVLVTGLPGVGKSRLAREFLDHARTRSEPPAVWIARGQPLRAGSASGLLMELVQSACGLVGGEPAHAHRDALKAHMDRCMGADKSQRVTEFLGELIGVPFPGEESLLLTSARRDAQLMSDQMRAAFLDFLAAECQMHAVLILIEDLQWGDISTVRLLDGALRHLAQKPIFVLALARPEIHDIFPKLWDGRPLQEIRLRPLPRKAAEQLVAHTLGAKVEPKTMERIVQLSEGNAFYLEELIRAAAEGKGDELPETVVAMVQSRLADLDEESRRVLRAASIFGQIFWRGGVQALLGSGVRSSEIDLQRVLLLLEEREILTCLDSARSSGEPDWSFRHMLLRDGAYALLTDADRALGHRLAGAWLEAGNKADALTLAGHYERGEDTERAMRWYLVAAEQAFERDDLDAAGAASRRGLRMSELAAASGRAVPPTDTAARALRRIEALVGARQQEIASGLPSMPSDAEPESAYRFAFIPGTRVFHVICSGRWTTEFTRQYITDFQETVKPLLGHSWGKLINLDAWLPTEPDAAEAIIDFLRWAISENLVRIAYVLSNSSRRLQARRIIETSHADVISEFFATEDEGLAWLRENGL